jgi:hypothetical protein
LDPGETADLIMEVNNSGQADISDVEVTLGVVSDYVTLLNPQQTIPLISSEGTEMAVFTIEVADDAPVGTAAEFDFDAQSGVFSASAVVNLTIGLIVEDWESNSFTQFNWTFSGNADWEISSVDPYEGAYCSQSGDIGDNQTSSMILNYTSAADDSISFYKAVSSESSYDYLYFIIDDNTVGQWSGEVAWSREVYFVSAGAHTFKWMYSKDGTVTHGDDMGRVDFIVLPPALFPTVDAGADASICAGETFTTEATAEDYNTLEWTTSGDGTFDDPTVLNSVYTPGTEDITNGEAVLTLTAYGDNGSTSNSMLLQILQTPAVPDIPDGDTELCEGVTETIYTTNGMEGYTYSWEISPADAGTTESDSASAMIAWNAGFTGDVEISVQAINLCGESDFSDPLAITIFQNPVVDLGEDTDVCMNSSITLDAGNEGATYLWSTGETTQTIEVDSTGMDENNNRNISVVVTDAHSCSAEDDIVIHFIDCSGIDENTSLSGISIFPNPNNGRFTIRMNVSEEQDMTVDLLSITGKIVYTEKMHVDKGNFSKTWNIQHLNNQMYYLRMSSDRGTVIKKLIVK